MNNFTILSILNKMCQDIIELKNLFISLQTEFNSLQNENIELIKRIVILEKDTSDKLLEKDYQILLSRILGKSHKKNKFGITDISTDNSHIEIKNWYNYKNCLGQLKSYNTADPKNFLIAAFFGDINFKDRAIELMHCEKIDVWELNIIENELLIEKYPYISKETSHFIENYLIKTNNDKDKIKISELKKYINDTNHIPLVGYKLINTETLQNIQDLTKLKDILLENFQISENRNDFVKVRYIKDILKSNGIKIEKNTLKYMIEDVFEGIEFRADTKIEKKHYKSIFLYLTTK